LQQGRDYHRPIHLAQWLELTVCLVRFQLHRHQDEISMLQQRRDIDIPQLALQDVKQRHWMVERRCAALASSPLSPPPA